MTRIVAVRAGALGDFLLGIPALRALRAAHTGAALHLVGPPAAGRLAVEAGVADTLTSVDDPALAGLFESAVARPLPPSLLDAGLAVVWLSRGAAAEAALRRAGARQVVAAPPFPPPGTAAHVADWLGQTLAPLGVALPGDWDRAAWLCPPAGDQERAQRWQQAALHGRPYLVMHPGSGGRRKNWPASRWVTVLAHLQRASDLAVVLTAGPADEAALSALDAAIAEARLAVRPLRLTDLSLEQLSAVLARASLYLGNDSGVSHLAAALGVPAVAVFGPTNPGYWRPRGPRAQALGGDSAAPLALPPAGDLLPDAARWPPVEQVAEAAARALRTGAR